MFIYSLELILFVIQRVTKFGSLGRPLLDRTPPSVEKKGSRRGHVFETFVLLYLSINLLT